MGNTVNEVMNAGKNAVHDAASFVYERRWEILYGAATCVVSGLCGIGLATIALDISGVTDETFERNKRIHMELGKAEGYALGYTDGRNDVMEVVKALNSVPSLVEK